jgi:hypothetical protein
METSKDETEQHVYVRKQSIPVHYTAIAWSLVIRDWAQEQRGILVGSQPSIQQHDGLLPRSVLTVFITTANLQIISDHILMTVVL